MSVKYSTLRARVNSFTVGQMKFRACGISFRMCSHPHASNVLNMASFTSLVSLMCDRLRLEWPPAAQGYDYNVLVAGGPAQYKRLHFNTKLSSLPVCTVKIVK